MYYEGFDSGWMLYCLIMADGFKYERLVMWKVSVINDYGWMMNEKSDGVMDGNMFGSSAYKDWKV